MTGLSRRNLLHMGAFASRWSDVSKVPQPVALLPWGHIRILIDKLDTQAHRNRYAASAVEHGWSRQVLLNHIKNRTLDDTGAAERNFKQALTDRIAQILAELGAGFDLVGRQVHFKIDSADFSIDRLFFSVTQLRYIVSELKKGAFEPGLIGQRGSYIALVHHLLRKDARNPTIGILICGDRSGQVVHHALNRVDAALTTSTCTCDSPPQRSRNHSPVNNS